MHVQQELGYTSCRGPQTNPSLRHAQRYASAWTGSSLLLPQQCCTCCERGVVDGGLTGEVLQGTEGGGWRGAAAAVEGGGADGKVYYTPTHTVCVGAYMWLFL